MKLEQRIQSAVKKVTEAQIILTRDCQIRCGYCKLAKNGPYDNELGLSEWKLALTNLDKVGFKTVKIMGGEPTVKEWLPEMIQFSNETTNLRIGLLTNGQFSDEYGKRLADVGLMAIFASIDGIDEVVSVGRDAEKKSHMGYSLLLKAKDWGIPLRASNTVINRKNIEQIPELVDRLSQEGIYVNLCPVIWTNQEREYSQQIPEDLKFKPSDEMLMNHVMIKLLQMKHDGARISVPDSYLINASRYGINVDWQCQDFSQLRIDADGALTLCNDFRTDLTEKHNVLDLTQKKYLAFVKDWYETRAKTKCGGCYWSCFLQAEDNIKQGQEEFHYAEKEGIISPRLA
ncbi:radical SAM protein [Candidatus Woesearchaeota archaeon]|nr:radical SAM protein [Candidatus Woesearchaeota archaeon]